MSLSFVESIDAYIAKTGLTATQVLRTTVKYVSRDMIFRSRVDTGNFRSQWKIGINDTNVDYDYNKRSALIAAGHGRSGGNKNPPIDANESLAQLDTIDTAVFGDSIYVSNNAPYGSILNTQDAYLDVAILQLQSLLK